MKVQDLIEKLLKIENKNLDIVVYGKVVNYHITDVKVKDCYGINKVVIK